MAREATKGIRASVENAVCQVYRDSLVRKANKALLVLLVEMVRLVRMGKMVVTD